MNFFKWLYLWFFLDKLVLSSNGTFMLSQDSGESRGIIYQSELNTLLVNLRRQLPGKVLLRFFSDGRAVIEEDGEIVVTISIFPKADGRKIRTYVVVDLKPMHIGLKAWIQFAFIGFKVRFRKPILSPVKA